MDGRGYLRPVRCKSCGAAQRPVAATCRTCRTGWRTCRSRPAPAGTSALAQAVRNVGQWNITFATDFSGMDMAAFALDRLLLGPIAADQKWGSDVWRTAQAFCEANHRADVVYPDMRLKEYPGPPL
eukprot:5775489-Lingulodinium_polyedra.AAC.1